MVVSLDERELICAQYFRIHDPSLRLRCQERSKESQIPRSMRFLRIPSLALQTILSAVDDVSPDRIYKIEIAGSTVVVS